MFVPFTSASSSSNPLRRDSRRRNPPVAWFCFGFSSVGKFAPCTCLTLNSDRLQGLCPLHPAVPPSWRPRVFAVQCSASAVLVVTGPAASNGLRQSLRNNLHPHALTACSALCNLLTTSPTYSTATAACDFCLSLSTTGRLSDTPLPRDQLLLLDLCTGWSAPHRRLWPQRSSRR